MIISYDGDNMRGNVELPASKSISNRCLIMQALSEEQIDLTNLSEAKDTQLLIRLLKAIREESTDIIDSEDAGTVFRFLTAFLAIQVNRSFILTGTARMQARPIAALVDALRSIGADIQSADKDGYPPLKITGRKLKGGELHIDGIISSQFISALCLIAPVMQDGLKIKIDGTIVSASYIDMTLALMMETGIKSTFSSDTIVIRPQKYQAAKINIENDWSSAAFFYCMTMLMPGTELFLEGLSAQGTQGDRYIADISAQLNVKSTFTETGVWIKSSVPDSVNQSQTFDLRSCPDLAVPFILTCAIAFPHIIITGTDHLQYKESERLTVLQQEAEKFGLCIHVENDRVRFSGALNPSEEVIFVACHHDHRIAMSMSLMCLRGYSIAPDDMACVEKSFPGYWEVLKGLGWVMG